MKLDSVEWPVGIEDRESSEDTKEQERFIGGHGKDGTKRASLILLQFAQDV